MIHAAMGVLRVIAFLVQARADEISLKLVQTEEQAMQRSQRLIILQRKVLSKLVEVQTQKMQNKPPLYKTNYKLYFRNMRRSGHNT
mmetsp:Transcript_14001/g.18304  ORF Transcript_14001/g.18304 Transcript_14001/m.18304 type:complete len:86 (-) Transcript_14001:465-722(-)